MTATATVTQEPPTTDRGEVWLVYVSCARPGPETVARVRGSHAQRNSVLTVVPAEGASRTRVVKSQDLPEGDLGVVEMAHLKGAAAALSDFLVTAPGLPKVLVAVDRVAQLASCEVAQHLHDIIVTGTLEAAERVVARLQAGAGPEDVLHPPGFSVALAVADAGVGRAAGAGPLIRVNQGQVPPETPWLTIGDNAVEARTFGMGRMAARAVIARQGPSRRVVEVAPRRLLLGPANYAGQAGLWARAVRDHAPGWTARNVQVVPTHALLMFGADLPLTSVEWGDPATRLDLAVEHVAGATDIVVEAMRPLLAVRDGSDEANGWDPLRGREDVDALRASGRNVALLFHGSEVRRPSVHARLTPWSPFYGSRAEALTSSLEKTTEMVHQALAGFEGLLLVSTPDLIDHVPDAVWLPPVVGPASFIQDAPALSGKRPVVAHAPSRSWLKGSQWVDPILQRMDREGLLTYRRLQNLPTMMMPSLLRQVDVVIDQVVLGNPGVLAAQAMAAGRLVLAHLPEPVRARFPDPPPVVETTPATIEQVLLSIIENPEHYAQVAGRGVAFARKYHDGRMSARVLTGALGS